MHSHNTFPSVAQALKCPIWLVPDTYNRYRTEQPDFLETLLVEQPNPGHFRKYRETQANYHRFAEDFIKRAEVL